MITRIVHAVYRGLPWLGLAALLGLAAWCGR